MFGIVDPFANEPPVARERKEKKEKKERKERKERDTEHSVSHNDSNTCAQKEISSIESRNQRLSRLPPPQTHEPHIIEYAQRISQFIEMRDVFSTTCGLSYFERMLLVEHSEENLLFWISVQEIFSKWTELIDWRIKEKEKLPSTSNADKETADVLNTAQMLSSMSIASPLSSPKQPAPQSVASPLTAAPPKVDSNAASTSGSRRSRRPRIIPFQRTHTLVKRFRKLIRNCFQSYISPKSEYQVNIDSQTGKIVTGACEALEAAAAKHEPMLTWKLDNWPSMPNRYIDGEPVPTSLEEAFGAAIDEVMDALLKAASTIEELMRKDTFHRFRRHAYFVDFYVDALRDGIIAHDTENDVIQVQTRVDSSNVNIVFQEHNIEEPSLNASSIKSLSNRHKWAILDSAQRRGIFTMFTPCTDESTLLPSCIELYNLKCQIFAGKASMDDPPPSQNDTNSTSDVRPSNASAPAPHSDADTSSSAVSLPLQPKPPVTSYRQSSYTGGFRASSNHRGMTSPPVTTKTGTNSSGILSKKDVSTPSTANSTEDQIPPPPPGPPPARTGIPAPPSGTNDVERRFAARVGDPNRVGAAANSAAHSVDHSGSYYDQN